ncbi:MAG: NAD(+) diphosphatase [Betaproteobacteria bacterium]|nr:MAG: NAD(+) diphosphatase [Betaproteobacteria bacterium]
MLETPSKFVAQTAFVQPSDATLITLSFRGTELLVHENGQTVRSFATTAPIDSHIVIGRDEQCAYAAQRLAAEFQAPEGSRFANLRSLFGILPDEQVAIAGRALQLLEWDRTHQFCGACATPTVRETHERARRCPACGLSAYPRISPAMMCLVTKGAQILLARNVNFPAGRFSALAGFLEAGESVEDAVHREVHEEVGIQVSDLRYVASQSWPFPHSLMIAFTAEYAGGDLLPNGHEIAEAHWFDKHNLPQLPPKVSIARSLIEATLARL